MELQVKHCQGGGAFTISGSIEGSGGNSCSKLSYDKLSVVCYT